jgi:hypothetical protein
MAVNSNLQTAQSGRMIVGQMLIAVRKQGAQPVRLRAEARAA